MCCPGRCRLARLRAVKWRELVERLRELGFEGPFQGGRHPYMIRGDVTLTIPNRHRDLVSVDLLERILRRGGITRDEWLGER